MLDTLDKILGNTEDAMKKAVNHLETELVKVRAGKANPNMLDGITADYYGNPTAINSRLRDLLSLFDRNAYLGYTATPFANIFIDPESVDAMKR